MRVLVTGGGGFLGGAIAARCLARGDAVRSFARGDYPALAAAGVDCRRGDLADAAAVADAVAGVDLVFHAAAKAGVWGRRADYVRTNVDGTRHVIAACRAHGVERLVFTSSPSVVFGGVDQPGVDETVPYPERYLAHYPATKALAEQCVTAANDDTLATVALRPHLIWGPGDPHLVPRLVARARAGRLRLVGSGTNRVDATYIDNAADAHLLAADRLRVGAPVAGRVYFVANDEPMPLAELINRILAAAGCPPVTRRLPAGVAYAAGAVLEAAARLAGRTTEPAMTRFVARQLSTDHWFDLTAARRDLGYAPRITTDVGLQRLAAALQAAA